MLTMFRSLINLSAALILIFALSSCNESKNQLSQGSGQAEASLDAESPLGQFLSESEKPAVIKFYADWCSTCKKYEPTYNEVASEMGTAVDFYRVNVDDANFKGLLRQLKISRIPETVFVNQSRTNVSKKLGSIPKVKLEKLINNNLG